MVKYRQESQLGTERCEILPGSGVPEKLLNPVQEFLTNSSTRFRNFS